MRAEQWHPGTLVPGLCAGCDASPNPHVHTLEGTSYDLTDGDWVIEGVNGEFYPCKPDVFDQTYERLDDAVNSGMAARRGVD